MVCFPVSQAMAAVSVDTSAGVSGQVLFPGDTLINVGVPVIRDGAEVVLDTPGSWTNTDEGTVYTASMSEDWSSIVLTAAGSVLVVENGTSSKNDGSDDSGNHYSYSSEDTSSEPKDTAYYPEGETVKLTAAQPSEGMMFAGWETDSSEVYFEDASSAETTITMPGSKATVTATYKEEQTEAPAPETADPSQDTDAASAEPGEEPADPDAASADPGEEPVDPDAASVDQNTEPAEPNTVSVDQNTEPAGSNTAEGPSQDTGGDENTVIIDLPESGTSGEDGQSTVDDASAQEEYPVTVNDGTGAGTFAPGEWVTVTANEYDGMEFTGWYVASRNAALDDAGSQTAVFQMPEEEVVVSAQYAAETGSETAQADETESETAQTDETESETVQAAYTVSVQNGILNEGSGTSEGTYTEGQSVKIRANDPAEGMQFKGWTVQIDGADADPAAVLEDAAAAETVLKEVKGSTVITANYEAVPDPTYTIKVANGTLSSAEAVQDTAAAGTWIVKGNRLVVITANPNPAGQAFIGWIIMDEQGTELDPADLGIADAASASLTLAAVSQNLIFQAQYEGIEYNVTVNDGEANYPTAVSGTVVTITADEAPEGMEFDYWKVDSGNVSLADSLSGTTSFTMPMADVTVSAYYKLKEYELTVENGTGSQQYFHLGDAVTVTSNYPASGKEFDEWVATSGNVDFTDSTRWKTTFSMPDSDVTVEATYKNGPSTDDNYILDIVSGGEYYAGDTIKFTASGAGMDNTDPNPGDYRYRPTGYQIGNVTGSWNGSPYTTSMSIKAAGEYTLKVTYAKEVYDGSSWVADGTTDTKSVTFRVIVKAAGVATGDNTPIALVVAIAAVSCVLFLILLVVVIRRKRNNR